MSTLVTNLINSTWVAPSGVTQIVVQPCDSLGTTYSGCSSSLTIVPDTSYTVTINTSSYTFGTVNTFGSIYQWTGSGYLKITFVE